VAALSKVDDTFAEAFKMYGARIIITAINEKWATKAANCVTGFATSVIGCGCEAGIEGSAEDTPDGRSGISVLLFTMSKKALSEQLLNRIGQCILTCPTAACYNGLDSDEVLEIGKKLRYFGDGFQMSKVIGGKRFWRIPIMEGEFLMEESYGIKEAVGGGNILILGNSVESVLEASERAVSSTKNVKDVILPFPGGIVKSGSKVGSKYKFLHASTNTSLVPHLQAHASSVLPSNTVSVQELVFDSLSLEAIKEAMKKAILSALEIEGVIKITAGNYGGNLGKFNIYLKDVLEVDEHA